MFRNDILGIDQINSALGLLNLDVLVEDVEHRLIRGLDAHVDMVDMCLFIFLHDILVTEYIVNAGFHKDPGAQVPLDQQVEDSFPSLTVKRRRLVGEHDYVYTVRVRRCSSSATTFSGLRPASSSARTAAGSRSCIVDCIRARC